MLSAARTGADDQDRTGDLVLTKDVLCQLSYIGTTRAGRAGGSGTYPPHFAPLAFQLERETGIEPATNSLEGCDSTTELLPPKSCSVRHFPCSLHSPRHHAARDRLLLRRRATRALPPDKWRRVPPLPAKQIAEGTSPPLFSPTPLFSHRRRRKKSGGEGRVRTSVGTRPADLQSAAIDRSATSPNCVHASRNGRQPRQDAASFRIRPRLISDSITVYCDAFLGVADGSVVELAEGFEPPTG